MVSSRFNVALAMNFQSRNLFLCKSRMSLHFWKTAAKKISWKLTLTVKISQLLRFQEKRCMFMRISAVNAIKQTPASLNIYHQKIRRHKRNPQVKAKQLCLWAFFFLILNLTYYYFVTLVIASPSPTSKIFVSKLGFSVTSFMYSLKCLTAVLCLCLL